MVTLLSQLENADLQFIAGAIQSPINLTDDRLLNRLSQDVENPESRDELVALLDEEIRYLGSSDLAYGFRKLTGREPGVPFRVIIRDVAKLLKVRLPRVATDAELLRMLVTEYTSSQFASLSEDEQINMLADLGVDRDRATSFVAKSAGVFAIPVLIQTFSTVVVDGLIKKIIFGTIAKFLGSQLAKKLFSFIAGKFPWWLAWVGPIAWTFSIGWTTLDLQGPAARKTVPVVLYLGLCTLREPELS